MRSLRTGALLGLLAAALALAPSASAALVGIYRNGMETEAQRKQVRKLSGARCRAGDGGQALLVTVGKRTRECAYRTPAVGRDLEIAATGQLLGKTPKPVRNGAFLALELRSGGGAKYQLAVYPVQRKAQLRKFRPDGTVEYLRIEKNVAAIGGVDEDNALRLRAFNVTEGEERGNCRLLAFVGRQLVADVVDPGAGELQGRVSGFSVGSAKAAKGLQARVDDVIVRVPSPF